MNSTRDTSADPVGRFPAELVLQPGHLRIIATLQQRELTTSQLAGEISDITRPTLYRHVRTLLDAGILIVTAERRVHGATERTLTVAPAGAYVRRDDLAALPVDRIIRFFGNLLALIADRFAAYVRRQPRPGFAPDEVRFYTETVHLTDAERGALLDAMRRLVDDARRLPAAPGRRRQLVAHITFPTD